MTGFSPFNLSCISSLFANVVFPEDDGPAIAINLMFLFFAILSAIVPIFFSCNASSNNIYSAILFDFIIWFSLYNVLIFNILCNSSYSSSVANNLGVSWNF